MALDKEASITADGGLHEACPYVCWRIGESEIVLDGEFTIAELQWLIEHIQSNSNETVDEKA